MAMNTPDLERMCEEADTPEKARAALREIEAFLVEHPDAVAVRDWGHMMQMLASTPERAG
jgi:hypothetical protein